MCLKIRPQFFPFPNGEIWTTYILKLFLAPTIGISILSQLPLVEDCFLSK